ncbi:hypothetical protein UPYG_G00122560 [Umbra pygmaea]|uniref:GAS2-like protein 2 n=1 Tax=Umbra pygmaea TaxID=75934 RepID=A0ABD0X5C6_UMBPY
MISTGMNHATNQSIKPFKSSEEYMYAMKEDLAEWLRHLYDIDIDVNNIFESLETGAVLCSHANNVTRVARDFTQKYGVVQQVQLPTAGVTFVNSAQPATFLARDNISNFITWCRQQMDIKDVLMFETDDLVLRKNEKNFVLCLLEVARRASRFGMAAPVLIQLEHEIEEEIREELETEQPQEETPSVAKPPRRTSNTQNLDEMVQHLISRCTCPTQFPMVKVSEGKYRVGDSSTLIFVRILRNHVMVRVGGGWDTLEHYLDKHDPCRCTAITHKLAQRPGTAIHEIKPRLPGHLEGQGSTMSSTLLISRHGQTPLQTVWTPSSLAPTCSSGALSSGRSRASPAPGTFRKTTLNCYFRLRQSASTPTLLHQSGSKDEITLNSSTRTGREATRLCPPPRQTSSLPRSIQRSSTPQPQPKDKPQFQRPKTPLVLQCSQPQTETGLIQSWTKSQFASKLRQSSALGSNSTEHIANINLQRNGGANMGRATTPVRGNSPARYTPVHPITPARTIEQPQDNCTFQKSPDCIPTVCPSKTRRDDCPMGPGFTPFIPTVRNLRSPTPCDIPNNPSHGSVNRHPNHSKTWGLMRHNAFGFPVKHKASHRSTEERLEEPGYPELSCKLYGAGDNDEAIDSVYLFNPPPISPAQEACLYRSLEHEILSNLQQLSTDPEVLHSPFQNVPEWDHIGFTAVPPASEPSPHTSASKGSQPGEASFDAVISELSQGKRLLEKVCVESWVNTQSGIPAASRESSRSTKVDLSLNLKLTKACVNSTRSSRGTSVKSKEQLVDFTTSPDSSPPAVDSRGTGLLKTRQGSFRLKGALKRPERVPSMYKLNLWPRVRPRYDFRPGKKPSKIPTPIFYQRCHPEEDLEESRKDTHKCRQATHQHTAPRPDKATVRLRQLLTLEQEPLEQEESWV